MTTYYKQYNLSSEQKSLLKDLLIYLISQYDQQIANGGKSPYIARRSSAIDFLFRLDDNPLGGNDSIMIMMDDIIELCRPISDDIRKDYQCTTLRFDSDNGLIGILCLYSNEIIEGLKKNLSLDDMFMTSTSSFCQ